MRRTRLVIADRYPVVLQGLTSLFAAQYDFKIVASCSDGTSCIEAMRNLAPDVAILDVSMPNLTGLEILAIAIAENLSTRLVFFTASAEHRELVAATAAGVCSVIPKDATPEILVQSLREVADDWRLLPLLRSPMLRSELVLSREERNAAVAENVLAVLTDREREIMRLVSEGLSNKAIARRLNISHGTIKVHLHHMYQKLEINNRTVLAALAITQQ
jgi:RNA polymerase sigma factor (sigma-70 family)